MLAFCGRFASFLFAAFFENSDPNLFAKLAPFSDPGRAPKKGPCFFKTVSQLGKSLGPKFGVQIWDPILGPKFGPTEPCFFGCSSARDGLATIVFRDVNLAAATVGGLRAEARNAWFFRPRKVWPQFQLRLPREADSPSAPVLCSQTTSGRAPLVVNICHLANMTTLIHCLIP